MASKQMNIRIDEIHQELLEMLVAAFEASDFKKSKTEIIQKSIYSFAKEILGEYAVSQVIDKHYKGGLE